jgi:hypothetical protein
MSGSVLVRAKSFGSRIRKNAGCRPPTRILANAATGYFPFYLPELCDTSDILRTSL